MATPQGCIDLLSALASVDPRVKIDGAVAAGWAAVLDDVPDEVLVPAGFAAARTNTAGYLMTPGMVRKAAEPYLRKIARDVRSARIRGWVPDTWPTDRPIPIDVQARLAAEYDATNDRTELDQGDAQQEIES